MIKDILSRYEKEARSLDTIGELNGYYYATYDMLFVMRSHHILSQVTYNYMTSKIKVIKALIMYQKYNDVCYLNRLEKLHEI